MFIKNFQRNIMIPISNVLEKFEKVQKARKEKEVNRDENEFNQ